ncbi:MAG TPA: fructose-6-phosphate aldolase [Deinococcales bacterium]|nr:fructose-6-phosphate aldolase [Deinococcales bacterium]
MHLYLDTAVVDEIREIASWGVLSGVTTNPSLVASSGRRFEDVIAEVADIVRGPVSAEVTALEAPAMIEEGRRLRAISEHVVVKLPTIPEGLKACKDLASDGIPVNMTLCFNVNQAILTARAGAAYVSPFIGRIDDTGHDGMVLVKDIVEVLAIHELPTQVIAASVRHPIHVTQAALAGAHIATMPHKVFKQMLTHPLTELGLKKFLEDWEKGQKSLEDKARTSGA